MLACGLGGLAYYSYRLFVATDRYAFPFNVLIPAAALYAIGRGIYILTKNETA
jgi:hypothetical protein